jgi:glycosyltransferase involved in cell wall biosynthesis
VTLIPPAIEVVIEKPLSRSELHLDEGVFLFLHMSDTLSMPERKNPIGVIRAFQKAFRDKADANVKLVIKLSNLERQPALAAEVYAAMEVDTRIQLIGGYLDRNTLNNLINACDCYVSLHRAEGFGLPIAEAMYLGKPVIATHWSGNADFMNDGNSLPVRYKLVELEQDIGPYQKGQIWAEPDIEDAAEKMLRILQNRALSLQLGRAAFETIRNDFSPSRSAQLINARAADINLAIN